VPQTNNPIRKRDENKSLTEATKPLRDKMDSILKESDNCLRNRSLNGGPQ